MKKLSIAFAALFMVSSSFAQKSGDDISKRNSWLKVGVNVGIPVGDLSKYSSFAAGLDVSGQYLVNPNFGIGVATGYNEYFAKSGNGNFGAIPLGALLRYYPHSSGFFLGTDLGYAFLTSSGGNGGGFYIKPQAGYHNYDWNFYAYYNQVFQNSGNIDLQTLGVAATYNLRFK